MGSSIMFYRHIDQFFLFFLMAPSLGAWRDVEELPDFSRLT